MATRAELIQMVREIADANGIRQDVALAQINQESSFNPMAVNSQSSARGIAQFMPGTWAQYGTDDFNDAFDPFLALTAWGQLMSDLLARYGGDYEAALKGYYGGTNTAYWGPRTREYAATVLSKASQWTDVATGLRDDAPGLLDIAGDDSSGWFLPIAIGAGVLILITVMND